MKSLLFICRYGFLFFIFQNYFYDFTHASVTFGGVDPDLIFLSYIQCFSIPLKPLKTYPDLFEPLSLKILKKDLGNLGGVYGIIHVKSSKQYIGSSLNLYDRLIDHIKERDSNLRLQRSIKKYGLNSFNIVIYYFHSDPAVLLTDIETSTKGE